jgi:hypothetical protein
MTAASVAGPARTDTAQTASLAGVALLVLTGILCLTTGVHDTFNGDQSDAVVESVWAVALLLAPMVLARVARRAEGLRRATAGLVVLGHVAIAAAVLATVVAGHEVWNGVYVAGFAIAVVGVIGFSLGARQWRPLVLVPALVVALAFFTAGGAIVLGLAWLVVLRALRPA